MTKTLAEHKEALLRRRVKYVVEHGAMARLFKEGSHGDLQDMLVKRIRPESLSQLRSQAEYDEWLVSVVGQSCWTRCSRNGLHQDRWGYFAKLVNIVVHEIVSSRELFMEGQWKRLYRWLHVPLDSGVFRELEKEDPEFILPSKLKGMSRREYHGIQSKIRSISRVMGTPPIWLEDTWAPRKKRKE